MMDKDLAELYQVEGSFKKNSGIILVGFVAL